MLEAFANLPVRGKDGSRAGLPPVVSGTEVVGSEVSPPWCAAIDGLSMDELQQRACMLAAGSASAYRDRRAAGQGDDKAQSYVGLMFENGPGTERNYVEGVKWYR